MSEPKLDIDALTDDELKAAFPAYMLFDDDVPDTREALKVLARKQHARTRP